MKGGRSEARDPPFSARGRPEHSLRKVGWLNYEKAPQAAHWATFISGQGSFTLPSRCNTGIADQEETCDVFPPMNKDDLKQYWREWL